MIHARRWVIAGLLVVGMIAAMFGVRVPRAYACSCFEYDSEVEAFKEQFEQATFVFKGRALHTSKPDLFADGSEQTRAIFEVEEVWKGPIQRIIEVYNHPECGVYITGGETYLVYTYGTSTDPGISFCTRTMPMTDSKAGLDLEWLGSGIAPTDEPSLTPTKPPLTLDAPETSTDATSEPASTSPLMPAFDPTIGAVLLAVIALLVLALFIVMRRGGKA